MNMQAAKLFSQFILADKPARIKLLGDSITHGHSGTGYCQDGEHIVDGFYRNDHGYCWANLMRDFLASQYGMQVINNGCSGTTIRNTLENFDALVEDDDDLVICNIGTNSRLHFEKDGPCPSREEKLRLVYRQMSELAEKFQKIQKAVIFVANIPAVNEEDGICAGEPYYQVIHVNDIHDLWVKVCCERDLPLIDLYTAMNDYCDVHNIPLNDLLADRLHPNDRGYEVMFRLMMRQLGIALPCKEAQY